MTNFRRFTEFDKTEITRIALFECSRMLHIICYGAIDVWHKSNFDTNLWILAPYVSIGTKFQWNFNHEICAEVVYPFVTSFQIRHRISSH